MINQWQRQVNSQGLQGLTFARFLITLLHPAHVHFGPIHAVFLPVNKQHLLNFQQQTFLYSTSLLEHEGKLVMTSDPVLLELTSWLLPALNLEVLMVITMYFQVNLTVLRWRSICYSCEFPDCVQEKKKKCYFLQEDVHCGKERIINELLMLCDTGFVLLQ